MPPDLLRAVGVDPDDWDTHAATTLKTVTDVAHDVFGDELAMAFIESELFCTVTGYFAGLGSTSTDIRDVLDEINGLIEGDGGCRDALLSPATIPSWWLYSRMRENFTLHDRAKARARAAGYFSRKRR